MNIPIIRPIFKKAFWRPGPFQLSEVTSTDYPSRRNATERTSKPVAGISHYEASDVEMVDKAGRAHRRDHKGASISGRDMDSDSDLVADASSHTSQEFIIQSPDRQSDPSSNVDLESGQSWDPNGIMVESTYEVSSSRHMLLLQQRASLH